MKVNYWLELIRLEKAVKKRIDKVLQLYIGNVYKDSDVLKSHVELQIWKQLNLMAKNNSLNAFELDYNIEFTFFGDVLTEIHVTNVSISHN